MCIRDSSTTPDVARPLVGTQRQAGSWCAGSRCQRIARSLHLFEMCIRDRGYPLRKNFDMSPEANTFPCTDDPEDDFTMEYSLSEDGHLVVTAVSYTHLILRRPGCSTKPRWF